jgi:hypothetical protein
MIEKQQTLVVADWQLEQVSKFTTKGLALKAAAEELVINTAADLPSAQVLKKQFQALANEIDQEKKAITFPYRDFVKQLNALADECLVPTEQGRLVLDQKLLAFDEKVEAKRREKAEIERKLLEEQRLAEEKAKAERDAEEARLRKIESDRLAAIAAEQERERARIALEQDANKRAQRELEAEKLAQEAKLEAQRVAIAQKERAMAEKQLEIEQQMKAMDAKAAEAGEKERLAQEEAMNKVKGVRAGFTYEIENEDAVPRELCSSDSKKINAAIAKGLRVANGLRIFEKKRIQ